jgi:hypothetical protein
MGQCASTIVKPPTIKSNIDSGEVYNILQKAAPDATILTFDSSYSIIDFEEFKNFCQLANLNPTPYRLESHDCDDYSFIFLGKVREWYARNQTGGGLCVGILTGDLRLKEDDPARGHAVNCFIDNDKKLKIFDPMWTSFEEIKPWMSIWNIVM